MIVGCGDLTILLLGLGFHCFLFRKRKTASQPWQAIAQRFCSSSICVTAVFNMQYWEAEIWIMAEYMKISFVSNSFAEDMMFMSASSIKGKSTLLLREAARRFIFRSATVCGRSISRWLKAEKVRYAEKELSNKRRLLLKIYRFHKSLSIYILLS